MKSRQFLLVVFSFVLAAAAVAQTPPTITNQPAAIQTNDAGTVAYFTIGATGTDPLYYQWRKNATNILADATNSLLVLFNVLAADRGSYTVVVTNSYGSVTSSNAVLAVIDPVISRQPYSDDGMSSQSVAVGSSAVWYVDAAGTAPLSYHWRKNGTSIAGETNDSLYFDSLRTIDAGSYSVVVSNALGAKLTSSNAVLVVIVPPTISKQPSSTNVIQGRNATFSMTAAGSVPLQYQWFWNSSPIAGATNASLTLTNVVTDDEGGYYVTVSNDAGSTNSNIATLLVLVPPEIFGQPEDQTVLVGDEYVEFSVDADGTDPLTYQWRKNGTAIPGATDWYYDIVHNPGLANEDYTIVAGDAGSYSVVVRNAAGSVTSSNAILKVLVPPAIKTEPRSQTVYIGSNVTFTVVATGTAPLSYQWFFDDNPNDPPGTGDSIPGATSSNLTFLVRSNEQAGVYSCLVSNDACSWDVVDTFPADPAQSTNAILAVKTETNKPTITITSPLEGGRWSNAVLTVRGTATDNAVVKEVYWNLNQSTIATNNQFLAQGTTNWSVTLGTNTFLVPGTNTFRARSLDSSGNYSTNATRKFIYVLSDTLRVAKLGQGTLTPNYSNALLEIGRRYTNTAAGINGHAFTNWIISTNWLGGVVSNSATLRFVMQSNLTLTAVFADTSRPTLAITNLTLWQRVSNALFTVKGRSADNVGVSNVWYQLNSNGWNLAAITNNGTNWSAPLTLRPGTNRFEAYALDAAANRSAVSNVSFIYVVSDTLRVAKVGQGTLTPNLADRLLPINLATNMTAAGTNGHRFSYWITATNLLAAVTNTSAKLNFVMQSNLTLTVVFADTNLPALAITNPLANARLSNALAIVKGTARDNAGVAAVLYQLNTNPWATATGTTNWTAAIRLPAGTNVVRACAVDISGNKSLTNSVTFVSSNSFALSLSFSSPQPFTNGVPTLNLNLSTGLSGRIEVSTNLATWTPLTNFVGTNSLIRFRDSAATNFQRRYYRAVTP